MASKLLVLGPGHLLLAAEGCLSQWHPSEHLLMVHWCGYQTFEAAAAFALYLPGPSESPFQYRMQNQACRQDQGCVGQLQVLSVTME